MGSSVAYKTIDPFLCHKRVPRGDDLWVGHPQRGSSPAAVRNTQPSPSRNPPHSANDSDVLGNTATPSPRAIGPKRVGCDGARRGDIAHNIANPPPV